MSMPKKYLDSFFDDSFSYEAVQPLKKISKETGIAEKNILKLNANENPYEFPSALIAPLIQTSQIAHYPDPAQRQIRKQIANYVSLSPEWVLAGNGSDEVIDLLCRFLPQNSYAMIFPPTFSYYKYLIRLNRLQVLSCPRKNDFSIDLNSAQKMASKNNPAVVFLCSPNNPTGNMLCEKELQFFLQWDALIVVDEAYFEFSQKTYKNLLAKHKNLIILRTFSKFFGLAGLRIGYGLMQQELQQKLLALKYPYNINQVAEVAVEVCFANFKIFKAQSEQIAQTKTNFIKALQQYSKIIPYPSEANFVLCEIKNYSAKLLSKQLYQKGVLVRYFETDLLKNFIRISIGKPAQMEKFLIILKGILH
jgi:histidinol-phosphate aminotransferase